MSDNEEILKEFCCITGASGENARFFLESSVWNLEDALTSYYESTSSSETPAAPHVPLPQAPTRNFWGQPQTSSTPGAPKSGASLKKKPSISSQSSSRIITMDALKNRQEDSSDEEEGQRFYAGGSVHSGQEVVGPSRNPGDFINDLFRSVRELGGVEAGPESSRGSSSFEGVGYRLGQTTDDTEVVGAVAKARGNKEIVLRLWKNGFSVDDQPMRSYSDPDDREFLRKIQSGQVPPELYDEVVDEKIRFSVEDHRHENFPKATRASVSRAFTGSGHVLGSVTPNVVVSNPPQSQQQLAPPTETGTVSSSPVSIDKDKPTTTVSVRLNDGSRVQAQLNHSHTVGDLRAHIRSLRPELHSSPFSILTTYPSKELTDEALTLEQAGILNSSILIRLK